MESIPGLLKRLQIRALVEKDSILSIFCERLWVGIGMCVVFVCTVGYSDYDVFLENDEGSRVYRCKKLF